MRIELEYDKNKCRDIVYAGKSAMEWTEEALPEIATIDTDCILELHAPIPLLSIESISPLVDFIERNGYNAIEFPKGRLINSKGEGVISETPDFTLYPSLENDSMIETELYKRIALEHIKGGVYVSPASVFIDATVKIEKGARIYGYTLIKGDTSIAQDCDISFSEINSSVIGSGVKIRHSVIENSIVGDRCRIGPFSYLRAGSVLGEDVRVGDFVEIKQSTLGSGVKAAHLAYIGNARVGDNTNIGCGTVFANYDGKTKNLTTVGEKVFIGCNTNLVAPVNVGNNCFIAAGSTITEDMPDNAFAIARARQITKKEKTPN